MTNTENAIVETAPAPKLAKTATITLRASDGLSTIQIVAERKADGARTYVLTTGADKKTARGMSASHPTWDAAQDRHRADRRESCEGWMDSARTSEGFHSKARCI
jgi:hypothetical protein